MQTGANVCVCRHWKCVHAVLYMCMWVLVSVQVLVCSCVTAPMVDYRTTY